MSSNQQSWLKGLVVTGLIGLVILGVVVGGFYALFGYKSVDEREAALHFSHGALTSEKPMDPGAHFITPFFDRLVRYDTTMQAYTVSAVASEGAKNRKDVVHVPTNESLKMEMDVTVQYKVNGDKAATLYKQVGTPDEIEGEVVRPAIKNSIPEVSSSYSSVWIYNNVGEFGKKVEKKMRPAFEQDGLVLVDVKIRNPQLPDKVKDRIQKKVEVKHEIERQELKVKKQEKINKRLLKEAKGKAAAKRKLAQVYRQYPELLQKEYIDALKESNGTIYFTNSPNDIQFTKEVPTNSTATTNGS